MATFVYKARRLDGTAVEGSLPAENERAALNTLDRMGLFPLELSNGESNQSERKDPVEVTTSNRLSTLASGNLDQLLLRRKIGAETTARFARELADLAQAGVPMLRALDTVSTPPEEGDTVIWGAKDGRDDQRARTLLKDVRRDVAQGASLADALSRRSEMFSGTAISIVRAGEEGGFLPDALRRVATFAEREMALSRRLRGAMAYPAVLIVLCSAAVLFLLTWVVPRFSVIYEDLGGSLPLATRFLMGLGEFLTSYWPLLVAGLVGAAIGITRFVASTEGRAKVDRWLLHTPLVRTVVAQACIARFARTLGTLLSSGVGILRTLEIARDAAGNAEFSARLAETLAPVREGASLSTPLRQTQLFPPQIIEMIEVGQETGTLVEVLDQVGTRADDEVDHALRIFVTVLEPTLIVAVAGVVFFVVLAALLPVFSLNELIQ